MLTSLATVAAALALLAGTVSPPPSAMPAATARAIPLLDWEIVSRRPHDPRAFTQGLQLAEDGRLFESTGQLGESSVREVDPTSGEVLRLRRLPSQQFGEGLALVGDELVELTWKAGVARRLDAETFELERRYRYEGQGWGLCFDGERLVMSDGSDRLTFRDPGTFDVLESRQVSLEGEPVYRLNELECVGDEVWANVYRSDSIVRVDAASGVVTGVLDLAGVLLPHPADTDGSAMLNGIAWDPAAGTFLVTGKYWPELIEIRVTDPGAAPASTPPGG
jgi:glutaminyl-peptide cyclotransferase